MSESEIEHKLEREDVEELREVLKAVSDFLMNLKEPIKEFIVLTMNALNGKKLGEEVADFYRSLIEKGVSEKLAEEMTKEFLRRKLSAIPNIGDLVKSFKHSTSHLTHMGLNESIRVLEKLKNQVPPGEREKIEKALKTLQAIREVKEESEEGR